MQIKNKIMCLSLYLKQEVYVCVCENKNRNKFQSFRTNQ